jgi:hypothetical protein
LQNATVHWLTPSDDWAVGVRIKIKDTFLQAIPALFYLVLNTYLCLVAF